MTVFATGFRPFFLVAALWAVVAPGLWVAALEGKFELASALAPLSWHIHEMVFGFTGAVIAGFLLTAVRNWTKRPTASGVWLAGLVVLWLVGRLQTFVDLGAVGLALDLAFFPAVAVAIGLPLCATANRRNAVFPLLLLLLGVADAGLHAGWLTPQIIGRLGVDIITLIVVIIGGRIIPMFTKNALSGVTLWRDGLVEQASVVLIVGLLIADGLGVWAGPLALAAGLVHLVRLSGWGGLATLRAPILWVLHVGYLWVALALVLRGAGDLFLTVPPSTATHLLTVGGIGSLTLGMMSRVALGHTGRKLEVARSVTLGFGLVSVATVLRAGWGTASSNVGWLHGAAGAFSLAFLLYVVVYTPILLGPRADGRPG
ncbi:MAG: NnrS family protein [Proteobacteria bacterium]|nr:NnrS family protein [Pseudomonadota bacterium]